MAQGRPDSATAEAAEAAVLAVCVRSKGVVPKWRLVAKARRLVPRLSEDKALTAIAQLEKQGLLKRIQDEVDTREVRNAVDTREVRNASSKSC
jgi:hypothetical protein